MCWDVSVARARAGVLEGDGSDLAPGSAQWPWEGRASGGGGCSIRLALALQCGAQLTGEGCVWRAWPQLCRAFRNPGVPWEGQALV